MTGNLLVILTAAGGLLLGGAALINSLLSGPKVRQETMRLATQAADEQITNLREDNADVRTRLREAETKIGTLESQTDHRDEEIRLLKRDLSLEQEQTHLLRRQVTDRDQQLAILTEFGQLATAWMAAHHEGGDPPPVLKPFEH